MTAQQLVDLLLGAAITLVVYVGGWRAGRRAGESRASAVQAMRVFELARRGRITSKEASELLKPAANDFERLRADERKHES